MEKIPYETLKDKNNSTPEKVPVPEGSNPEYMRWETKVDASQKEVGVTDPEGKYHALENGQTFRIDRDRQSGRYRAIVTNPDGIEHILREGSLVSKKIDSQDTLDRERLNKIARVAADPKVLFGREVVLDDADKEEINRLATMAEPIVQDAIKRDPTWEKFQRSIADHPGLMTFVFPPGWLINGGSTKDDIEVRDTVIGKKCKHSPIF